MRSVLVLIAMVSVAHAEDDAPELAVPSRSAQFAFTLLEHFADMRPVTTAPTAATPDPSITQLGLVGMRFGFMAGDREVSEHVSFDVAIGGQIGRHGGFAYDAAILPLGIGVRLGADSFLALDTGLAAMGATGSLDDAVLVPIQLELEYGVTYHLIVRARDSFVFGADGRRDGAPSLPLGDELEGMVGVRVGKSDAANLPMGYFIGVAYKEMLGTRYVGLSLGYALGGTQ
ncbi:MAG TPA: hypothetical protein VFQ65_17465 [Kofleriaceae bacterium]|nr:hypothetical protein [Kofleriaceae bacterium]